MPKRSLNSHTLLYSLQRLSALLLNLQAQVPLKATWCYPWSFFIFLHHSYLHLNGDTSLLLKLYYTCLHFLAYCLSPPLAPLGWGVALIHPSLNHQQWVPCPVGCGEQSTRAGQVSEQMNPHHFLPLSSLPGHSKMLSCWNSCLFGRRDWGRWFAVTCHSVFSVKFRLNLWIQRQLKDDSHSLITELNIWPWKNSVHLL